MTAGSNVLGFFSAFRYNFFEQQAPQINNRIDWMIQKNK